MLEIVNIPNAETAGGTLGTGVVSAWLWTLIRARYPNLPEMPATVSPAVGAALWQGVQALFRLI